MGKYDDEELEMYGIKKKDPRCVSNGGPIWDGF